MNMQVRHTFAGLAPMIDDDSVASILNFLAPGDGSRGKQQMPEEPGVFDGRLAKARNNGLRNDQDMDWRLGVAITDRNTLFILVDDLSGDLALNDAFEKCHESCMRNSKAVEQECISFRTKSTIS